MSDWKEQTRRLSGLERINENPDRYKFVGLHTPIGGKDHMRLCAGFEFSDHGVTFTEQIKCPWGGPRDQMWVRETWQHCPNCGKTNYLVGTNYEKTCGSCSETLGPWKPSIHIFKEDSRLTQTLIRVRVERLQDITEDDARAEGVSSRDEYRELWDKLNAKRGFPWSSNPYVWVLEFPKYSEEPTRKELK